MLAIDYIVSAPYFYQTMAAVTICAMFIGATIYDGMIKNVLKAVLAIGVYALFLTFTNLIRIGEQNIPEGNVGQAYASTATVVFITFFYLLGMALGVTITKFAQKKI